MCDGWIRNSAENRLSVEESGEPDRFPLQGQRLSLLDRKFKRFRLTGSARVDSIFKAPGALVNCVATTLMFYSALLYSIQLDSNVLLFVTCKHSE